MTENTPIKKQTRGWKQTNGQQAFEQLWKGNIVFDRRKIPYCPRKCKFSQATFNSCKQSHRKIKQHCCCQRIQLRFPFSRWQTSQPVIGSESSKSRRRKEKSKKRKREKKLKKSDISTFDINSNKHFNDNSDPRDLKQKKRKKKRRKYSKIELHNKYKKKVHLTKRSSSSDRIYCSPKAVEDVNMKISQYPIKKNVSKELKTLLNNYSLKNTSIQTELPINTEKIDSPVKSEIKLSSTKSDETINMPKSLLPRNVELLNITAEKGKYLVAKNMNKSKSRSKDRGRSSSQSKYNLYYCKQSSSSRKSRSSQQRSTSHNRCGPRKEIVLRKYEKSASIDKSPKRSYSFKNIKTLETSARVNSDITSSKVYQQLNRRSKSHSRQSVFDYSSIQMHYERYTDILHEVKKILKKDIIGKRKLKYIFKKQQIHIQPVPSVQLRSSSELESFTLESEQKQEDDDKQTELNTLKLLQSSLAAKARESLNKKCIISPVKSITEDVKVSCSETNLFHEKLVSSALASTISTQPNISRTPSPALPLIRDEAMLKESRNNATHQLSWMKETDATENPSDFDLKLCHDLKCGDNYSNYLTIERHYLNTSKSFNKSSTSLTNSSLCDKAKDVSSSPNKNDLNLKESFSLYKISTSSQSRSYSRSLTPVRISSTSTHWSPILLLQNNNSNLLLKEDSVISEDNKKPLTRSIQSSPSRTTSMSELSRSQTPRLNNCLKSYTNICRTRSRSISFTKTSRSLSRSVSKNSRDAQTRSCSKTSTHTFVSSKRHSCNSHSCSSLSMSSASNKTSRPVSSNSSRSRSPSIPRRHGSPSFLDRRRITSARKRPVPYHRPTPSPLSSPSSVESSHCSSWSAQSHRSSETRSCNSPYFAS